MKKFTSLFTCFLLSISLFLSLFSCVKYSTETKKIDKGDTLIIAHRGLSGLEVENTEQAFIAAGERSYYGIESDVRKTSDGKFVMCHDADLKRIAGVKVDVESSTLSELQAIPLLDNTGKKNPDLHLSTLESYISICKEYDKQAILELKSDFTEEEIGSIIEIIKSYGYLDRVTFISFDYDNLLYVRSHSPSQPAMYLFSKMSDGIIERLTRDKIDVGIKYTKLTKSNLDSFHEAGLSVNCWTVDNKILAELYIKWGVDYITTNIIE